MKKAKKITFVMILVVLAICVVGTTLAWLTAQSGEVENTFTVGDVGIKLDEKATDFKMVPGHTIKKDPFVTIKAGSEDCYVFIEVKESENLDKYIDYAVKTTKAGNGDYAWIQLKDADGNDIEGIYYMILEDINPDSAPKYKILDKGTGTYELNDSKLELSWAGNEVLVKPTVTKEMMEALKTEGNPTLTFKAYAVQLWKNNTEEFTPAEAWGIAKPATQTQPEEGAEG